MYDCSIIPAAGAGSRFHDLGKAYPKCCLPYKNKPIIKHIVEECLKVSKQIYIVVQTDAQIADINFAINYNKLVKFVKVIETKSRRRGPATSLSSGILQAGFDGMKTAFIALSDATFSSEGMLDYVGKNVVFVQPVNDFSRWCMVSKSPVVFFDKPTEQPPTNDAAIGLYSLNVSDFNKAYAEAQHQEYNGEFQLSQVFSNIDDILAEHYSGEVVDLGTMEEYNKALSVSISREFNTINFISSGNGVRKVEKKSTKQHSKLMQEAVFMKTLPEEIRVFYPEVYSIDMANSSYFMECARGVSLRDLALYLDNSKATWQRVFGRIKEFVDQNSKLTFADDGFWDRINLKNFDRLSKLLSSGFLNMDEYLKASEFLLKLTDAIKASPASKVSSLYHGDLHFANCMFDFHTNRLVAFDPRGEFVGSRLYDVAKLYHSVYGMYDFIDAEIYLETTDGLFEYYDRGWDSIRQSFREAFAEDLVDEKLVANVTASLFLTMIPLHSHNSRNQRAFYNEYKRLSNLYPL